jgi:broad specificity phosphatase PhoE
MEVYLIRHAESEMNQKSDKIGGRSNPTPITPQGAIQAAKLGDRLQKSQIRFDSVYSSIAVRAIQTAEIVCKFLGYPLERIIRSEQLQELSQGDWEGKPRSEIYTSDALASISRDNWNFRNNSGESQRMVEERMTLWLNSLLELKEARDDILVGAFSHGMAIRCLVRGLIGSDCRKTYLMETENTSITKVRHNGKCWIPITLNDTAHLE